MSLGVKQNKTYLNVKEGRIVYKSPKGEEMAYDYLEGKLVGITKKERDFKGEPVVYWYFDIEGEEGELYSLSMPYSSGVAKAILNSLASVEELGKIRIETYQSGEFTKSIIYNNGDRLNWKYSALPPIEEVKVGERMVKDDTKRMALFNEMAQDIVNSINKEA